MIVKQIVNSIFRSNSYLLYSENNEIAWIVDPGDHEPILEMLESSNKLLGGILITHSHFDHIYGINNLCNVFPKIGIYSSIHAKEGLLSAKINRSYYTGNPYEVKCDNILIVENEDIIPIFDDFFIKVIYTPGHNNDCLSFKVKQYLFTGDALIPGIKVHTKSKFGDKLQAQKTIDMIINSFDPETIICPGHGDTCYLKSVLINDN